METAMKAMMDRIVRALVDNPEYVEVRETLGDEIVHYQVVVAKSDLGQVIGKKGRIANALRTLAVAAVRKQGNGRTVKVEIEGESSVSAADLDDSEDLED
jgi:predicted RNA-binding protein YlqC (UPF0109 family)